MVGWQKPSFDLVVADARIYIIVLILLTFQFNSDIIGPVYLIYEPLYHLEEKSRDTAAIGIK